MAAPAYLTKGELIGKLQRYLAAEAAQSVAPQPASAIDGNGSAADAAEQYNPIAESGRAQAEISAGQSQQVHSGGQLRDADDAPAYLPAASDDNTLRSGLPYDLSTLTKPQARS